MFEHPDSSVVGIAHLGFQNAREWITVSRLGVEVQKRFGELRGLLRGFVTFGAEHQDLQRKFEMQGVTVHNKKLKAANYNSTEGFDMSGMLQAGIVLPAEMPEVVATARGVGDYLKSVRNGRR